MWSIRVEAMLFWGERLSSKAGSGRKETNVREAS